MTSIISSSPLSLQPTALCSLPILDTEAAKREECINYVRSLPELKEEEQPSFEKLAVLTNEAFEENFPDSCQRILIDKLIGKFNHYLEDHDFQTAFKIATYLDSVMESVKHVYYLRSRFGSEMHYVNEVVTTLAKHKKEADALILLLSHPSCAHEAAFSIEPFFSEVELARSNMFDSRTKYLVRTLIHLLIITAHQRGVESAIKLANCLPYAWMQNLAVNHLIFRCTHPQQYKEVWGGFIEGLLPKPESSFDELFTHTEEIRKMFARPQQSSDLARPSSPLDSLVFEQNIEKAIDLFAKFLPRLRKRAVNRAHVFRSAYIIDALLKKDDPKRAKEFLPYLRDNIDKYSLKRWGFVSCVSSDGIMNDRAIVAFERAPRCCVTCC